MWFLEKTARGMEVLVNQVGIRAGNYSAAARSFGFLQATTSASVTTTKCWNIRRTPLSTAPNDKQ